MDNKKNFAGRIAAAVLAAVAAFAAAICVSAEGYNTKIMNSSFETPNFYDVISKVQNNQIQIGDGNDQITFTDRTAYLVTSKSRFEEITDYQFYWNTTASDNRMEIVTAVNQAGTGEAGDLGGYFGYNVNNNRSAAHGNQFAELVAEEESSLFQTISTDPGATLTWSLAHRARYHRDRPDIKTDSMALFIGPEQEGLKKKYSTSNDIFKQMALLLYTDFNNMEIGMSNNRAVKLYSKPVVNGMAIDESCVSTIETDECTQEWFCWIITSDNQDWYRYSDTYKVPKGQTKTTLAFTALNSASDGTVSYVNEGNLLDDIQLSVMHQLTVRANIGGQGVVSYTYDDVYQDDSVSGDNSPYIKSFDEGTEVSVTAAAAEGYTFVGAMVDGVLKRASDFNNNNNGSYKLTMDKDHSVILYFSKTAYVVYDPNKGSFNNTTAQTEYSITQSLPLTQSSAPENGDKVFVGWRVFSDGNRAEDQGVFIPENHTISYDQNKKQFKIIYGSNNELYVPTTNDTILFAAEYRNKLSIQSCYVGVDNKLIHNDPAGGTVTIQLENETPSDNSVGIYAGQRYTVEAAPKHGYEFKGWYYTFDSEDGQQNQTVYVISETDTTYSGIYAFNENVTIHAQFVEIAVAPILNVIAEDGNKETILTQAGIESTDPNYTHGYGGSEYGNTIATSFHITREFANTTTMPGGVWTIYLPVNGTFMKVPNSDDRSIYNYVDFSKDIVNDSANSGKSNFGTIYDMNSSSAASTEMFKVYVGGHNNLTLTNATVNFGIVIDNVYAPKATAGFKVETSKPDDVSELGETNSIYTHYEDDGKYQHDEGKLNGGGGQ